MVLMILPGFSGHWKIIGWREFGCEVLCKMSAVWISCVEF